MVGTKMDQKRFDELVEEHSLRTAVEAVFNKYPKFFTDSIIVLDFNQWQKIYGFTESGTVLSDKALEELFSLAKGFDQRLYLLYCGGFSSDQKKKIRKEIEPFAKDFEQCYNLYVHSKEDSNLRDRLFEKMPKLAKEHSHWKTVCLLAEQRGSSKRGALLEKAIKTAKTTKELALLLGSRDVTLNEKSTDRVIKKLISTLHTFDQCKDMLVTVGIRSKKAELEVLMVMLDYAETLDQLAYLYDARRSHVYKGYDNYLKLVSRRILDCVETLAQLDKFFYTQSGGDQELKNEELGMILEHPDATQKHCEFVYRKAVSGSELSQKALDKISEYLDVA